ncbi:MAG: hypothetical protein K2X81_07625 [Candidatus Obscuribacterales bacterium]|nr:hypothetical protein [Candidatus Obscuribacterales bacterium]
MSNRLRSESIRLLYVGVTRARDMLIFAPYSGRRGQGNGMDWLDELQDANGKPILQFPNIEGVGTIVIGESEHAINVRSFRAQATPVVSQASKDRVFVSRTDGPRSHAPFLLKPSKITAAASEDVQIAVPIVDIGDRIPISGKVEMDLLGDCVHRFLAADNQDISEDERLSIAERLRELWSVSQRLSNFNY